MKKKWLAFVFALIFHHEIYACGGFGTPAYTGQISYSLDSLNPLKCNLAITMYFDLNEGIANDSIWISWGDDSVTTIFATAITEDSDAALIAQGLRPFYKHTYIGSHTYLTIPANGYAVIALSGQYRAGSINNIEDGSSAEFPFYIEAQVTIDTIAGFTNQAPFILPPNIQFAYTNIPYSQNPGAYDPEGDSIYFDLLTPLQEHDITVPLYTYPGQYCISNGDGSSIFEIDHSTGDISWANPCQQGVFAVASVARKYRNGRYMGSVMSERNIYVADSRTVSSIPQYTLNPDIQIFPNPATNTLSGTISTTALNGASIQMIATDGTVVIQNVPAKEGSFNIDISMLASGLYFVKVQDGQKTFVSRFVKE